MPTAPPEFGFDYSIGGVDFTWDLDTAIDRLLGRDGASLGDAVGAAGDIAGAAGSAVASGFWEGLEPWVSRLAVIILAFVFIAGGIALLSSGNVVKMAKEAVA